LPRFFQRFLEVESQKQILIGLLVLVFFFVIVIWLLPDPDKVFIRPELHMCYYISLPNGSTMISPIYIPSHLMHLNFNFLIFTEKGVFNLQSIDKETLQMLSLYDLCQWLKCWSDLLDRVLD
jgi:hypothetical protein